MSLCAFSLPRNAELAGFRGKARRKRASADACPDAKRLLQKILSVTAESARREKEAFKAVKKAAKEGKKAAEKTAGKSGAKRKAPKAKEGAKRGAKPAAKRCAKSAAKAKAVVQRKSKHQGQTGGRRRRY